MAGFFLPVYMPMTMIDRVSDWKGRLIAYCGGAGVSVFSASAPAAESAVSTASPDILTLTILPGTSVSALLSILGALVVVCRLIFDIWTYFDQRRLATRHRKP
ncbi:hypothetical protein [Veronia pacifica]|uniref:Uncharacterized protein n=1 Tax=Veronia pacifica TaxID=1080227 RepID=A0A1C3EAE5_9GAMM|nr:hypothetical protein [Veronia pacifica]ODA30216.1 hypothetical protein A8L45_20640 [Veronia pacifica]